MSELPLRVLGDRGRPVTAVAREEQLSGEPDHECSYSSGEDYPEHCVSCGRDVRDDPRSRYQRKGESPKGSVLP